MKDDEFADLRSTKMQHNPEKKDVYTVSRWSIGGWQRSLDKNGEERVFNSEKDASQSARGLTGRTLIWKNSKPLKIYNNGKLENNQLNRRKER